MSTYYETPPQLVKEDKKVLEEAPTYRVSHLLVRLGWVDLDFECPILLRQMEFRHNWLGKMAQHLESKSTQSCSATLWITLYH